MKINDSYQINNLELKATNGTFTKEKLLISIYKDFLLKNHQF